MLPESLEKLRLTFEANKSPLKKWPNTVFGHVVHSSLSRQGAKVAFLKNSMMESSRT